jgi:hypothetical protein
MYYILCVYLPVLVCETDPLELLLRLRLPLLLQPLQALGILVTISVQC